ncbi:hypothetical protein ABKV19_010943 [Rosa sericea]
MSSDEWFFHHRVVQTSLREPYPGGGSGGEVKILFKLLFYRVNVSQSQGGDPVYDRSQSTIPVSQAEFWVNFGEIKSNNRVEEYRAMMADSLSNFGVPQDEHPHIIENIFQVVDEAVFPDCPIVVGVWDTTFRSRSSDQDEVCRPNFVPAAELSIQGLQQVTLDSSEFREFEATKSSCAICLEDFAAQGIDQLVVVTTLPCSHYYHGDCIVKWLEISHLCPICRYPMPIEQVGDPSSNPLPQSRQ